MIAVALHRDTVVGMARRITYHQPDKPLQMSSTKLGVASAYLRRGIGKALVSCLLEAARGLGCTEAWVATEEDNDPARALYRALGGEGSEDRAVVYTFDLSNTVS